MAARLGWQAAGFEILFNFVNFSKHGSHFFADGQIRVQRTEIPVIIIHILHQLLKIGVQRSKLNNTVCVQLNEILCDGRRFVG